jgi:hypothetical protein
VPRAYCTVPLPTLGAVGTFTARTGPVTPRLTSATNWTVLSVSHDSHPPAYGESDRTVPPAPGTVPLSPALVTYPYVLPDLVSAVHAPVSGWVIQVGAPNPVAVVHAVPSARLIPANAPRVVHAPVPDAPADRDRRPPPSTTSRRPRSSNQKFWTPARKRPPFTSNWLEAAEASRAYHDPSGPRSSLVTARPRGWSASAPGRARYAAEPTRTSAPSGTASIERTASVSVPSARAEVP